MAEFNIPPSSQDLYNLLAVAFTQCNSADLADERAALEATLEQTCAEILRLQALDEEALAAECREAQAQYAKNREQDQQCLQTELARMHSFLNKLQNIDPARCGFMEAEFIALVRAFLQESITSLQESLHGYTPFPQLRPDTWRAIRLSELTDTLHETRENLQNLPPCYHNTNTRWQDDLLKLAQEIDTAAVAAE